MFTLIVCTDGDKQRSTIHLVDEDGRRAHSTETMQAALNWLTGLGEFSVTAITDAGPELFLIEPCEGLQLTLPAYSLRRAFTGRCCDPPPLPGLRPDPTRAARILDELQNANAARRRRRDRWLRRATGAAADAGPR